MKKAQITWKFHELVSQLQAFNMGIKHKSEHKSIEKVSKPISTLKAFIPKQTLHIQNHINPLTSYINTFKTERIKQNNGVVLPKEKRTRVETRVDRPNLGLNLFTTTSITHHFRHCYHLVVAISIHRLQGSVASHNNQLSAISHIVTNFADIHHSFLFIKLELHLSGIVHRTWIFNAAGWRHTMGDCHLGCGSFGVAFLSVFISFKMVWSKLKQT